VRILVTGHTGFKGSWLALMLHNLGHQVHGYSLDPLPRGIFELAKVSEICESDFRDDIRNKVNLDEAIEHIQPEIVLHLAAQPLVLTSYEQVYETYSTNVTGTLNVLDASTKSRALKGVIVITTDKVYLNDESKRAFIESDTLGGKDPYSSSKALADLLTQNWSRNNERVHVAIARAGNVIGGGDVCANRLIPDIVSSISKGQVPQIRNPMSVRPWQHVMDCLNGYIALIDFVSSGRSDAFNFGPNEGDFHTVEEVTTHVLSRYGIRNWESGQTSLNKEAGFLTLNSAKAMKELNWKNKISFTEGLDLTVDWYKVANSGADMREFSNNQIAKFLSV
jgi:CDP-glucose 4,6-dehydratase